MNQLEKEFKKAIKKINSKIIEAGESLTEANNIAKKAGIKHTHASRWFYNHLPEIKDPHKADAIINMINWQPVLKALDDAGWATSGMSC